MGWNTLKIKKPNPILTNCESEERFYFVHSYYVDPDDTNIVIATTNYGGEFCAAFQMDNLYGVQFHPEKSHRFGLKLLENFIKI